MTWKEFMEARKNLPVIHISLENYSCCRINPMGGTLDIADRPGVVYASFSEKDQIKLRDELLKLHPIIKEPAPADKPDTNGFTAWVRGNGLWYKKTSGHAIMFVKFSEGTEATYPEEELDKRATRLVPVGDIKVSDTAVVSPEPAQPTDTPPPLHMIWKYRIGDCNVNRPATIRVGGEIVACLRVGYDDEEKLCIWAEVDASRPAREYTLAVRITGMPAPDAPYEFLQSVPSLGGNTTVWHVYAVGIRHKHQQISKAL